MTEDIVESLKRKYDEMNKIEKENLLNWKQKKQKLKAEYKEKLEKLGPKPTITYNRMFYLIEALKRGEYIVCEEHHDLFQDIKNLNFDSYFDEKIEEIKDYVSKNIDFEIVTVKVKLSGTKGGYKFSEIESLDDITDIYVCSETSLPKEKFEFDYDDNFRNVSEHVNHSQIDWGDHKSNCISATVKITGFVLYHK